MQPWPDAPGTSSYHAVFHDHATFGGHAYSADGIRWTYSDVVPFSNRVEYTDDTVVRLQRRERPHLIFAEGSRTIIALTNSAEPGGISGDRTFTLVQGVKRDGVE